MPLEPHEDEDQRAFMARCMRELSQAETHRPQDQMVAICMSKWRDRNKSARARLSDVLERALELLRSKGA